MSLETKSKDQLLKEVDELESRLEEAEGTLGAIRNGEVDALYVEGPGGDQIFTLKGADQTYRTLIEDMNQGAVTTTVDGTVLYANKAFAEMIQVPHELIVGSSIDQYIAHENKPLFEALFQRGVQGQAEGEIALNIEECSPAPVYVSINMVLLDDEQVLCIAVTDLTEQKRQEEIVQSERLSRAILEAAGAATVVCDNEGRIIRANHAAQRLVENPVLMKSFGDVFAIQMIPKNNNEAATPFSVSQVLAGDSFHDKEVLLRKQNEEELYFLLNATHLRSEEGIIGCVLVLTDTTELKQLEMELEAERERLAVTLLSIGDAVIATDLEGRILLMNGVAESLTGWSQKETIGQSLDEVFHIINEKTREPCENPAQKVLQSRKIVGLANDTVLISRDGTERVIADVGSPILSRDGNIIGAVLVFRDITDRRREEEVLRESEENFRRFFEDDLTGDYITTADGIILDCNAAFLRILGYKSKAEAVGESITVLYPELSERDSIIDQLRVTGKLEDYETTRKRKDGILITVNENIVAKFDEDCNLVEIRGYFYDITERKRLEEELLRAQKLESVGVLAGGIAHDFNNILTTIIGNVSLAKNQVTSEDETFDLLNDAEMASTKAQMLTRQLLTFAKGGAPVKETASIKDILKESYSIVLRGSKSSCEFSIAKDLWSAEVDVGQMSQVINNIVINANQAMPEGGIIQVAAENLIVEDRLGLPVKAGRYIKVSIKDQGVGIAKKHLSKIFDPYFTTKYAGSGLGLATTYSIIRKHDGHITVESQSGVGTTFHIYLPASDKAVSEKEEARLITGQGRILVMDDEASLRKTVGRMLQKLGYESELAKDGAEAIDMYKEAKESEKPYDAVILDLTVPGGMGGKEAIKKLLETDPEVKGIVSSGYSDDPVLSNFHEYGFKAMMPKPFDPLSLGKVLHEVLQDKEYDTLS